eukprot:1141772-Pelagomonas_calceolata.AAC.6
MSMECFEQLQLMTKIIYEQGCMLNCQIALLCCRKVLDPPNPHTPSLLSHPPLLLSHCLPPSAAAGAAAAPAPPHPPHRPQTLLHCCYCWLCLPDVDACWGGGPSGSLGLACLNPQGIPCAFGTILHLHEAQK